MTIDTLVGEGDVVTWHWTVSGTHRGMLGPIPPSWKSVRISGVVISRFVDGNWTEDYNYFDFYNMLQQVGAVPALA
jgi:predicted ester cyclase